MYKSNCFGLNLKQKIKIRKNIEGNKPLFFVFSVFKL